MSEAELFADGVTGWRVRNGEVRRPFLNAAGELRLTLEDAAVHADTNGDGVIDGRDASVPRNAVGEARFISVPTETPFGRVDYPLFVSGFQDHPDFRCIFFAPAAAVEGKIDGQTVRFYSSGTGKDFTDSLTTMLVYEQLPREPWPVPLSRTITIDGRLYEIELLEGCRRLSVKPVVGEVASVRLQIDGPAAHGHVLLESDEPAQRSVVQPGEAVLFRPGKYRISQARVSTHARKEYGPTREGLSSLPAGEPVLVELKPGENLVTIGAPYHLDFQAGYQDGALTYTSLAIVGRAGESYRVLGDYEDYAKQQTRIVVRSKGQEQDLGKIEYG